MDALELSSVRHFRHPIWIPEGAECSFPNPLEFEPMGLVAGGGDLSRERILSAYRSGIFPWYDELPILWWSPDPRAIIDPESLHISRSLRRRLRTTDFVVTCNSAPEAVLDACAQRPEGTWLDWRMRQAYLDLFEAGYLATYEVWQPDADGFRELVGGLYGVLMGGLYAAESKFHRATDASKVGLVCAVTDLFARGVELFDVQFSTPHLITMGVHEIRRHAYLARLEVADRPQPQLPDPGANLLAPVCERLGIERLRGTDSSRKTS